MLDVVVIIKRFHQLDDLLRGLSLGEALREGMAAAMLAVESPASAPEFSARDFTAALALVPEAEAMHQGGRIGETNDA